MGAKSKMADAVVVSEQMCFNVDSPADPASMATQFDVIPSPLVVCNSFSARQPGTLVSRMELATLLARRELSIRRATKSGTTKHRNSFKDRVWGLESKIGPSCEPLDKPRPPDRPPQKLFVGQSKVAHLQPKPVEPKVIKSLCDVSNVERMSDEVLRLQDILLEQLRRLHHVMLNVDILNREQQRGDCHGGLDREDGEREQERRERRANEQVTRSTRILYQLQNKVVMTHGVW